jgi:hypothetical protein
MSESWETEPEETTIARQRLGGHAPTTAHETMKKLLDEVFSTRCVSYQLHNRTEQNTTEVQGRIFGSKFFNLVSILWKKNMKDYAITLLSVYQTLLPNT